MAQGRSAEAGPGRSAGPEAAGTVLIENSINEVQTPTSHTGGRMPRWCLPARGQLALLSFLGFLTNYMLRVNMNIALVEMVRAPFSNHSARPHGQGEVEWSVHQQGKILGSLYWCYVPTLLLANPLSQRFGAKAVFGWANLLSSVGALLTPLAVRDSDAALLAVRVLQGVASGPIWPTMHVMASKWIQPHDRSKFVSTYYGNSVGAAVAFPLCGVLVAKLGWPYAFYVPGALGVVWCVLWWKLVFNTPAEHPWLSWKERDTIQRELEPYITDAQPPVPLRDILLSAPVWAVIIGNLAGTWTYMLFVAYGPTYFKFVHGLDVEMNGLVTGLPNIARFVVAVMFSCLADRLLKSAVLSVTNVRKLATAIALLPPAGLCLALTHVGGGATTEIVLWVVMVGLGGCASSGTLANSLDLSPNFAGVTLSIVSSVSVTSGAMIPVVVSAILSGEVGCRVRWRAVFGLTAGLSLASSTVFLALARGEVQPWNGARGAESPRAAPLLGPGDGPGPQPREI